MLWLVPAVAIAGAPRAAIPITGLDHSWSTGVDVAAARHLRFGHDILFTFGPWGYLDHPLVISGVQFGLGACYTIASVVLAFCAAYLCLRRTVRPAVAAPLACLLTLVTPTNEPGLRILGAGLALAILALERRTRAATSGWRGTAPTVLLAVASAFVAEVKFSEGVTLLVLTAIVAVSVRSLRALVWNCAAAAVAFAVTFLSAWLVAGQSLADLVPWLRGSKELTTGYAEAMGFERHDYLFSYLVAGVLTLVAVVLAVRLLWIRWNVPALGLVVLVVAMLDLAFKQGFSRHDGGHEQTYFVIIGFLLLALAGYAKRPVAALVATALAFALVPGQVGQLDPFGAREQWRESVQATFDTGYRDDLLYGARRQARARYRLPSTVLSATAGHPVSVDMWETTLPWVFEMDWRPVPVFQAYAAYTPYLDDLNARTIRSAPDNQQVLRETRTDDIDGRNPRWDTPRYLLALVCGYKVVLNTSGWTLLRHDRNQCTAPQTVTEREVAAGESVSPPAVGANQLLVVRFTPRPDGLVTRLGHALLKDWSPLKVTADGTRYRLPEGLADGPLLVSFPRTLGWAKPFDGFSYKQLSFDKAGTLEFQVVTLG